VLNGKAVVEYSLNAFINNLYVDDILIACRKEDEQELKEIIKNIKEAKKISFCLGGNSRQETVYNAISSINSDIVIIQDGARPILKDRYINECIENMEHYNGVTVGAKTKHTIKIVNEEGLVTETTKRSNTYEISTPQCFNRNVLLKGHIMFKNEEGITDDCMILEKMNEKVKVIDCDYDNIKITTKEDLIIGKQILKEILYP
jgi:2-C-methyl-D-erythritol 4-phosphate cytidylyltransferase